MSFYLPTDKDLGYNDQPGIRPSVRMDTATDKQKAPIH